MNKHRNVIMLLLVSVSAARVPSALGVDATSFVEPSDWSVGDNLSTYQEWDVLTGATGNLPDIGATTQPPLAGAPTLSALPPGFLSSGNNLYAFSGEYTVEVNIPNHSAGAPAGFGTLVRVQSAASENPDVEEGVIIDSVRITDTSGVELEGGTADDRCAETLLFSGIIGSPFGDAVQDEWLLEFWVPDFVGDFKVLIDCRVHTSFSALRVDALNVAAPFCSGTDINCDCRQDEQDIAAFTQSMAGPDETSAPIGADPADFERADLDADGDVDLQDAVAFQRQFAA